MRHLYKNINIVTYIYSNSHSTPTAKTRVNKFSPPGSNQSIPPSKDQMRTNKEHTSHAKKALKNGEVSVPITSNIHIIISIILCTYTIIYKLAIA